MGNVKGTNTEANLNHGATLYGHAGELYAMYASVAEADGLHAMAEKLREMSNQKFMITKAIYHSLGVVGTTRENLERLLKIENEIWTKVAPQYMAVARAEGLEEDAIKFERVAAISKMNESTINIFLSQIDMSEVMKSAELFWKCEVCGNIERGDTPPMICDICESGNSYKELKQEITKYMTGK